jgi:hypothetical protein
MLRIKNVCIKNVTVPLEDPHDEVYNTNDFTVLAHFRSKRTGGGFSPITIHRLNVSVAHTGATDKTRITKRNIFLNSASTVFSSYSDLHPMKIVGRARKNLGLVFFFSSIFSDPLSLHCVQRQIQ